MIKDLRHEVKRLSEIADTVAQLKERIGELEKQVRRRNRKIFGQSSARVTAESLTGTGKVVYEQGASDLDQERAKLQLAPAENPHSGGGRTAVTKAPTTRTEEHRLPDIECCGKTRKIIGFNATHQLDIIKAAFE
jgi:hypothetical protein